MTIDTTVTNGQFVGPEGTSSDRSISIHDGTVLNEVELEDVWRTVDASGYLVLPGMIQPGSSSSEDDLELALRGSTMVIRPCAGNALITGSFAIDSLICIGLNSVSTASEFSHLIACGYRVFSTTRLHPDLEQVFTGGVLRVNADRSGALTNSSWSWADMDCIKLVVPATHPEALQLAKEGIAMLEIPAPRLAAGDASDLWDVVANPDLPVHVTNGGVTDFPVLQFLYHEGSRIRSLPLSRIASVTSTNPAQWHGLFPQKGTFYPGSDGDIVVFDPETPDSYRDSQWPGRVIFSIQRGNIVLYNGQLHTLPGDGLVLKDQARQRNTGYNEKMY